MSNVRRIYVEKKDAFAVKAEELQEEIQSFLGIEDVKGVRVLIRYDVENISDEVFARACRTVFSEPPVDTLYEESFEAAPDAQVFSVVSFSYTSTPASAATVATSASARITPAYISRFMRRISSYSTGRMGSPMVGFL